MRLCEHMARPGLALDWFVPCLSMIQPSVLWVPPARPQSFGFGYGWSEGVRAPQKLAGLSPNRGMAKGAYAPWLGWLLMPSPCRYPLEGRAQQSGNGCWVAERGASDLGREPEWPLGQGGR